MTLVQSASSALLIATTLLPAVPGAAGAQTCAADCDGGGKVTVAELVTAVTIALGTAPVSSCQAADRNTDGRVAIDELVTAVTDALDRCAAAAPAPTRTPTKPVASRTPTITPARTTTPGLPPNALDESFGSDGLAAPKVGLGRTYIAGLANAPGGGIYFVGDLTAGTQFNSYAGQLTEAGDLDPTFNDTGIRAVDVWTCTGGGFSQLNESMYEIAVDGTGRVLIAGSTKVDGGSERYAIARFTSAGALDTSFGQNGCATIDAHPTYPHEHVSSMRIQPDGKILLAGWTWADDSVPPSAAVLVRLTEDGDLDGDFATGGRFTADGYPGNKSLDLQSERVGVDLQSDGRIIFMHTIFLVAERSVAFGLTRLSETGSLDTTFGDGGTFVQQAISGRFSFATDLAVVAGDRVIVGGWARNADNKYDFALMRTTANGQLDTVFGTGGIATLSIGAVDADDYFADLAVDSAGRIVVAGVYYTVSGGVSSQLALARFTPEGMVDTEGFCASGTLGPSVNGRVRVLIDGHDRIVVGYYDPALGNPTPAVVGIGVLRFNGGSGTGICESP